jgi:uncharacterized membrane protein YeaQ/YmgE (transglycosylase-associated protein family)
MGIIGWIILGGLAGWIASMIAGNNKGQGVIGNIFIGIIGAVVGGWVFEFFGASGVNGFNLWSFGVALVGAIITLWIGRLITGQKSA